MSAKTPNPCNRCTSFSPLDAVGSVGHCDVNDKIVRLSETCGGFRDAGGAPAGTAMVLLAIAAFAFWSVLLFWLFW